MNVKQTPPLSRIYYISQLNETCKSTETDILFPGNKSMQREIKNLFPEEV
jgi:hypothetical protein